jgi:ribose transport system ATP-binding protein
LEELFLLADRISVLKDGKYQGTFLTKELTKNELVKLMVGRELTTLKSKSHRQDEVLLSVSKLTGNRFNEISFELHRGEILGLAGLVGAGRTEIARAIFGADPFLSGEMTLRNNKSVFKHPRDAIAAGMAYVPEERKTLGLFPEMTIQDNIIVGKLENALIGGLYNSAKVKQLTTELVGKLRVVARGIQQKVNNLSGGNQQKVVLARWLLTKPDVLIVDEPTHGVDVGAKFEIYEILKALAKEGKGIIIISSDLPELLGISDRIVVIKEGRVAGEVSSSDATEENIMALAAN